MNIKFLGLGFILFLTTAVSKGQNDPNFEHHKERTERVNTARIGFITERLDLTSSEAEKFWPIYNEYSNKRQELFFDIRKRIRNGKENGLSPQEKNKLIDETLKLKEQDLELQKIYKARFLKVISINQYVELLNAEKDFNSLLIDKIKNKKHD